MELRAIGTTLDANDPVKLADFWQAAIGFKKRVGTGDPAVTLSESDIGRPLNHLTIQKVPEGKTAKHRLHLDLFVTDDGPAIEKMLELGATVLTPAPEKGSGHMGMRATVMADPEGGEFCIVCRAG